MGAQLRPLGVRRDNYSVSETHSQRRQAIGLPPSLPHLSSRKEDGINRGINSIPPSPPSLPRVEEEAEWNSFRLVLNLLSLPFLSLPSYLSELCSVIPAN
jgi:hypothetical protein